MSNVAIEAYDGAVSGCAFYADAANSNGRSIEKWGTIAVAVSGCKIDSVAMDHQGSDLAVSGCSFEMASSLTNEAIKMNNGSNLAVAGCVFDGPNDDAYIKAYGSYASQLSITGNKFYSGLIDFGVVALDNITIEGNTFWSGGGIEHDPGASNVDVAFINIVGNTIGNWLDGSWGHIWFLGTSTDLHSLLIADNVIRHDSITNETVIDIRFKSTTGAPDNGSSVAVKNNTIYHRHSAVVETIIVSGVTDKTYGSVEVSYNTIYLGNGVHIEYVRDVTVMGNVVDVTQTGAYQAYSSQQWVVDNCGTAVVSDNRIISGLDGDYAGTGAALYVEAVDGGSVRNNDVWGCVSTALDTAIEISGPFYVAGNRYHGTHSLYGGTAFTNEIVVTGTGAIIGDNPSIVDASGATTPSFERVDEIMFTRDVLAVEAGIFEIPMLACEVIDVRVRLRDQPTGTSVIFDVNKNGSTIFTTQANRPEVATSTNTDTAVPNVTSFADDDYLSIDIDQIDSNAIGAGAVVVVRYRRV